VTGPYWVKITSVQSLDNPDATGVLAAAAVLAATVTATLRQGRPEKIYAAGEFRYEPTARDADVITHNRARRFLPPLKYDHRFPDRLLIIDAGDQDMLRRMCHKPEAPFGSLWTGCAIPPSSPGLYGFITEADCVIILASESDIERTGWTLNLAIRHEIGHCNGWPANHPGAR
jgi:hypothetical protein